MTTLTKWIGEDGSEVMLDGSTGVKTLRGMAGLDSPPIANTVDQRTSGGGGVLVHRRSPPRTVTLPLFIDTDVTSVGAVAPIMQGPGSLVSSNGRTLRNVIYEGGFDNEWGDSTGGVNGIGFRKVVLDLVALDPWWYGDAQYASGVFDSPTPWNPNLSWSPNLPWNGGSSTSVVNPGDTTCPVVVVASGAASSLTFAANGAGWSLASALGSGDYVTVDGRPGSRGPRSGSSGLVVSGPSGNIDWSLLTEGSQLFELQKGSNSIIYGAASTDGSSGFWLFWTPRYLTP